MSVQEKKLIMEAFVDAFQALGHETYGMSPAAAIQLYSAVGEFLEDQTKGVRGLMIGASIWAAEEKYGGPTVRIPEDYQGCPHFWISCQPGINAQVTSDACDYITKHVDVFNILEGLLK